MSELSAQEIASKLTNLAWGGDGHAAEAHAKLHHYMTEEERRIKRMEEPGGPKYDRKAEWSKKYPANEWVDRVEDLDHFIAMALPKGAD